MTEPLAVPRIPGSHVWGVRFRPGAGAAFLGVDAQRLTDERVALSELWPDSRPEGAGEVTERLGRAVDDGSRVAMLDALLRSRLGSVENRIDDVVLAACEAVAGCGGTSRVVEVAEEAGLSSRQLERRFAAAVGVPPKLACRVARLRASVGLLHETGRRRGLAEIALVAGYADQSHFTRDFRDLTGTTPGAYRASSVDAGATASRRGREAADD